MRIEKEFAPMTIHLETEEDRSNLICFLNAAMAYYDKWGIDSKQYICEKLVLFLKDLER